MKIPMKEFFKNRSKSHFVISPDNKKMAFLDSYENRTNIFVMDIKTEKIKNITTQQKRNISLINWKGNDFILFPMDNDGDENYHIKIVDLNTKEIRDLTPGKDLKAGLVSTLNAKVFIKLKKEFENKILLAHNKRDPKTFDIYMLDIITGKSELIEKFEPGWETELMNEDTFKSTYLVQSIAGGSKIFKGDKLLKEISSKDHFSIIGYTSIEKNELFVSSNINRDKISIFKSDLELNIKGKPFYESDSVDINGLSRDYFTKKPEYAVYSEDKLKIHYFDKKLEEKHETWKKKLIQHFPNESKSMILVDSVLGTNDKIISFETFSDIKLGDEYYYFVESDKIIKFTEENKLLNPDNLAEMKPISYKARDGLTIHGYLTLPKNTNGPVPIIVNPHGGPWVRDTWGYNSEVQFFANRGYGVFQPNFRISTGYGKEHYTKGWHQWGLDCQHDITDGTQWLIDQGYTKKGMIAIYGGSYGGYATLMGIINEPDLYSAAVDYVGVSDLFTFWEGFPEYWKTPGMIFEEALGDPNKDPEHYKSISPVYRANEIKTPLMVVQGAKDPRVPIKQAEQIVDALKKNNVKVEYLLKEDEGHGFANQENRFELYEQMIKFFDKNLKLK